MVAIFCGAAAEGRPATIYGDGHQTRDFILVSDVVAAFAAAERSDVNGSLNVSTGTESSLNDLAGALGLKTVKGPGAGRSGARASIRARPPSGSAPLPGGLERTLETVRAGAGAAS